MNAEVSKLNSLNSSMTPERVTDIRKSSQGSESKVGSTSSSETSTSGKTSEASFAETLNKIQTPKKLTPDLGALKNFEELINSQPQALKGPQRPNDILSGIKFSNHAVDRMMHRGINFNPSELKKISEAVEKAELKGAKNSLILMDESALIVSVKNKTVVTVIDKSFLKENVFTNIDSTIII